MPPAPSIPRLFRWVFPLLFFLTIFNNAGFSQGLSVSGKISDTSAKRDCSDATVVLLRRDSTVLKQTRSGKNGQFFFVAVLPGEYLLHISHITLEDRYLTILVYDGGANDLGIITVSPKAKLLSEVIVTPKNMPPKIKGDTLEFNTSGIKLRQNATVEDLLRRLPGVLVDPQGNIFVNGQKIDRLLINGEEFFANSPALATRMLNGDMIGKIQAIDQRSKEAERTGIEDRQKTKTLNLSLNESSKNSLLSKAEGGIGDQGYYDANGIAAAFKGSRQVSLVGMVSNTGNSGYNSTTGAIQAGLSIGLTNNDPMNTSAGTGIPHAAGTGMHFANRWDGGDDHLVAEYQLGHLLTQPISSTQSLQNLPDSTYRQTQHTSSVNTQLQNAFKVDFDRVLDSLSTLYLSLNAQDMHGQNQLAATTQSFFNDSIVNASIRQIHSEVANQQFRAAFTYALRGRKHPGFRWSVFGNMSGHNNTTTGYLLSHNSYYGLGSVPSSGDTVDQRKQYETSEFSMGGGSGLTVPIWSGAVLALKYAVSIGRNKSLQATFDKGDGKYNVFIDSLSTNFKSDITANTGTINIQGRCNTFFYTLGGDLINYNYHQRDRLGDTSFNLHYVNFSPMVNLRFNPTPAVGWNVGYAGNTRQPSPAQLQPTVNNTDPLHINLGNPALRPAYTHAIGMAYQRTTPVVWSVTARLAVTENEISTRTLTDSVGRQVSQPVNVDGSYNASLYLSESRRLRNLGIDLGGGGSLTYSHNDTYVDADLSHNNSTNATATLTLGKNEADRYNLQFAGNMGYTYTKSSLNDNEPVHYWTQNHSLQLSLYPSPTWEINAFCGYSWKQKASIFDQNTSTVLCNAFVSKKLLGGRLTTRGQVINIFNQDAGISRSIAGNQTTETHSNIIGRYFMLYISYQILSKHKSL